LRVGQLTHDTHVPPGQVIEEQHLDQTAIGEAPLRSSIQSGRPSCAKEAPPSEIVPCLASILTPQV
jgi:hypothetical protein